MVEAFDGLTQATFELGGGMDVRTKELCGQPTAGQRGVRSCTAVAMRVTSRTHAKNQERVERKARKGAQMCGSVDASRILSYITTTLTICTTMYCDDDDGRQLIYTLNGILHVLPMLTSSRHPR